MVSDALSGIDDPASDYADDVLDTEGAGQSGTGYVYDLAGNYATDGISDINIDKTAPTIADGPPQGTQNADGTWASAVTVPFSATDNLSGFAPEGALVITLAPKTTPDEGSNLFVTSDGVFDLAGNFGEPLTVGPFTIGIISPDFVQYTVNDLEDLRVYYEVAMPVRVSSVNPAGVLTTYAYHPLTPTDAAAFEGIALDVNAYEFIANRINLTRALAPYLVVNEDDTKKKKLIQ